MLKRQSPTLPARRSVRAMAALCALMLVASNAIAAMGMCVAKTVAAPPLLDVSAADEMPCPLHAADNGSSTLPDERSVAPHCPQDDPGAQARAGDVPATDGVMIAPAFRPAPTRSDEALYRAASTDELPSTPLYARLSRLLL